MYIYQKSGWPAFSWQQQLLAEHLALAKFKQGQLLGKMNSLGLPLQQHANLNVLTSDILTTSEIEDEHLDRDSVRSSLARHLRIDIGALKVSDQRVDGVVEMILDATQNYQERLTETRLLQWHEDLFPDGLSGMNLVLVGCWRQDGSDPMQVVSGTFGRERIHFEAPLAKTLPEAMRQFLSWFNGTQKIDLIIKAAIAHLWFLTLHPFDDGNGRIARALSDLLLARSEQQSTRFYSMSTQIKSQRKSYYKILESTQKGDLDITQWLQWFINCFIAAIENSEEILSGVLDKANFWQQHLGKDFNDRQLFMLNRVFDGFKGKLTSTKWAKMTSCSHDTATRDIKDLISKKVLVKSDAGGRSTSYLIAAFKPNK